VYTGIAGIASGLIIVESFTRQDENVFLKVLT
jgi:hypothetical protein